MEGSNEIELRRLFETLSLKEPALRIHAGDIIFVGQIKARKRRIRRMAALALVAVALLPVTDMAWTRRNSGMSTASLPAPSAVGASSDGATATPQTSQVPVVPIRELPSASSTPPGILRLPPSSLEYEGIEILPTSGTADISGLGSVGYYLRSGPGSSYPIVGGISQTDPDDNVGAPVRIECAVLVDSDNNVDPELWVRLLAPTAGAYTAGAFSADSPIPRCAE